MSSHLTLSQLQCRIKEGIEASNPLPYWVVAEVSEAKVNYSGHCYLELVEKGGDNPIPRAKVSATIWKSRYFALNHYFSSVTGSEIMAGIKLLIKVTVTYHELYGLSLNVTDIDPAYTLGDIERLRQQTIARLLEDGVFEMNKEQELPLVVQRIAVVSSANAAGYQDFIQELGNGPYRFDVTLFDAFMQGAGAEESVVGALGEVAQRVEQFDAVVIIRGGGSQSDLATFDNYRLCCHVAQFPLPILSGIGHDKDVSVVDLIAAVSLKTPTAVAVFLKDLATSVDAKLDDSIAVLEAQSMRLLYGAREEVAALSLRFIRSTTGRLGVLKTNIDTIEATLNHSASRFLTARNNTLSTIAERINIDSRRAIQLKITQLTMLQGLIEAQDPKRVLERGFSILRHQGRCVKDASKLQRGDQIEVITDKNRVSAEITNIL